jgi:hypothetical protein
MLTNSSIMEKSICIPLLMLEIQRMKKMLLIHNNSKDKVHKIEKIINHQGLENMQDTVG